MNLTAGKVKEAMKGNSSRDLWQVPLDQLHVIDGFNVRSENEEHQEHIQTLVSSILNNGFYQNKPLSGYVAQEGDDQKIYITDGHCRFEAAQLAREAGADIESLPVVVSPRGTSIEDLTVGLVTNNSGRPLAQYEIAEVCKRLVGFGWDEAKIGKRLSLSTSRVGDLLGLVGSAPEIRELVAKGEVSASQAIKTIKQEGSEAKVKLQAGVAKAKAAGKTKATARHIETKPSYKSVVQALLDWRKATEYEVPKDLLPVLKLARESME